MPKFRYSRFLIFLVTACTFGMLIIIMLVFNPPAFHYDVVWRKPLVGLLFVMICVGGIFAAVTPKACLGKLGGHGISQKGASAENAREVRFSLKGHHVDCGNFSNHVVRMNKSVVCAACSGLALGAIIALSWAVAYFFFGVSLVPTSPITVLIGEVAVALGLVEFKLKGYPRLLLNSIFVLGSFLTLVSVDNLTENLLTDFYLIGVTIVWIMTRILVSQWDHWRTCHACMEPCKVVETEKGA